MRPHHVLVHVQQDHALVFRWGTDDHGIAPKIPLFGSVTQVHKTYDDGNCSARLACRKQLGLPGSMMQFSWDSAYWVNSAVAKLAYSERTRAMPVVHEARACFEQLIAPKLNATEYIAAAQFARGDKNASL